MRTPDETPVESFVLASGDELRLCRLNAPMLTPYPYVIQRATGGRQMPLAHSGDPCKVWYWSLGSRELLSPRQWAERLADWFTRGDEERPELGNYARILDGLGALFQAEMPPMMRGAFQRLSEVAGWVVHRIPGDDLGYDTPESLPVWHPGRKEYRLQGVGLGNWSDPGPWLDPKTSDEYLRAPLRRSSGVLPLSSDVDRPIRSTIRSATLGVNLTPLRRTLSKHPELLEALEAGTRKGTGKLGANVSMVWQLAMRSLYSSADVPVLAVRENCQNSVDSIRLAIQQKQIHRDAGRFEVTWNPVERSLSFADNGRGMSQEEILSKFLILGESGKRSASGSDVAAGGFGIAKAVILGSSSTFKWRLHTRDNLVVSQGRDSEIEIFEAAPLAGFKLTVFDVETKYDYWWDAGGFGRRSIEERIKETLAANDLPGISLKFNGEEIRPLFSRRGGSKIEVNGSWGDGTTGQVKAFKRPDRRGAYWVRLGGLHQFKGSSSGDLGVDVVIDLATTVRPGDDGYPLNAGRDAFQGEARNTFRAIVEQVERENLSVGEQEEDEVFDAEGDTDDALLEDFASLHRALVADPDVAKVLEQSGVADATFHAGMESASASADGDGLTVSRTRIGTQAEIPWPGAASPGEQAASRRPVLNTNVPDDYVLDLTPSKGKLPWFPAGLQTPQAIRAALDRAENECPFETSQETLDALDAAKSGKLTVAQLRVIAEEMDRAARLVAAYQGDTSPRVSVTERKELRGQSNPFGSLGALRISRVNYDKAKARAFKRSPRKWLPLLLLWDATLKLMKEAGGITRPTRPGFVLEDGTIGLAQQRPTSLATVIYIHPDRLMEAVDANRDRPMAIAGYLHGVSAHELAHCDGRMGSGHDQSFVSAREDLGRRTAHILPQLASLATRLLKLPEPKDEAAAKLIRLEKQLATLRENRDEIRSERNKAVRALERELRGCRSEVIRLAGDASAQARAACTGACSPENPVGIPRTVNASDLPPEDPGPSVAAMKLVMTVRGLLIDAPPAGLDSEYIERFFRRYHQHLARVVSERLPRRPIEQIEPLRAAHPNMTVRNGTPTSGVFASAQPSTDALLKTVQIRTFPMEVR